MFLCRQLVSLQGLSLHIEWRSPPLPSKPLPSRPRARYGESDDDISCSSTKKRLPILPFPLTPPSLSQNKLPRSTSSKLPALQVELKKNPTTTGASYPLKAKHWKVSPARLKQKFMHCAHVQSMAAIDCSTDSRGQAHVHLNIRVMKELTCLPADLFDTHLWIINFFLFAVFPTFNFNLSYLKSSNILLLNDKSTDAKQKLPVSFFSWIFRTIRIFNWLLYKWSPSW